MFVPGSTVSVPADVWEGCCQCRFHMNHDAHDAGDHFDDRQHDVDGHANAGRHQAWFH